MERLSDLLAAGQVMLDVEAADFDACLTALTDHLAAQETLSAAQCKALAAALQDREALAATAIGRGVAIPHAYAQGIPRVMLLFARLGTPLPHEAPDGQAIDLIFMLTGPTQAQGGHLPLLARLVRLLHDASLLDDLRRVTAHDAAVAAVQAAEQRHA